MESGVNERAISVNTENGQSHNHQIIVEIKKQARGPPLPRDIPLGDADLKRALIKIVQ